MPKNLQLNFGTLNARGTNSEWEREALLKDALHYKLDITAIPETHIHGESNTFSIGDYTLYTVNEEESKNTHGTGILIRNDLKPSFQRITGRICTAEIQLKHCKLNFISVYAHTSEKAEKNPELRDEFYEILEGLISSIPNRNEIIIAGDFNAKTGSGYEEFVENMGKFGKGELNNSGSYLLEMCRKTNMYLTNTTFNHKLCHRTTWTAPFRKFKTWRGEKRKNPVRNQIDYVIVRCSSKKFVTNARSYGGTKTNTDHKLVKTEMKIVWHNKTTKRKNEKRIDVSGFSDPEKRERYRNATQHAATMMEDSTPQEKWNQICKITTNTAKEILGYKTYTKEVNDTELEAISQQKHKLQKDIEATSDMQKRKEKQNELKELKKRSKKRLKEVETQNINSRTETIERMKNDSTRYFAAIKELRNCKKQERLVVHNKEGLTVTSEEAQIQIVTDYFRKMLAPEEKKENITQFHAHKMRIPFTGSEIEKAAKRLKNGKSAGPDNVELELIKYAPIELHEKIAEILNRISETGESVVELVLGLLRPLQKPGKKKGPTGNLRPIILLSVLRKILTICLVDRTWNRIKQQIPTDQAAYQPGRGTTEQVFAVKLLCEKAIISQDYSFFLLLLDMSKAFDTVNRKTLLDDLQEVLDEDELHLISILTNRPKIQVKIGKLCGDIFETLVGVMQGDILSAILFIFYLANCLRLPIKTKMKGIMISPKYADDITYGSTNGNQIDELEKKVPVRLNTYDLYANDDKTEKYQIPKPPPPPPPKPSMKTLLKHKDDKPRWSALDWITYKPPIKDKTPDWTDCKLLGSKLDTNKDIGRRKGLTIDSMRKFQSIYKSKNVSIESKIKTFNTFAASVFLYNAELWTCTASINNKIDSFHRRMLRQAINIHWPKKISNTNLYSKTKVEPWSVTIKRRRLNWLGHLMRMEKDTPARLALDEALRPSKRKIGHPKTIWLKVIETDLQPIIHLNIFYNDATDTIHKLENLTQDRNTWSSIVKDIMGGNSQEMY